MFRLRVLGGFALDADDGRAGPSLPKRRAEAVLAVLAVCGDLGCSRERLLALLWPESDDAGARHGLRDALHCIRRTLGAEAVPSTGRLLRLGPAVVATDAAAFAAALAAGRPADAVGLYAGPLLDGFHVDDAAEFERWLDGERTRLARQYGEALRRLATEAEAAGALDEALRWWGRAVEHDPLSSYLVLQQVRVLASMGDRANAIRVAEGHARRLREELDLEPDPEVLATVERIRRGSLGAQPAVAAPAASGAVAERPADAPLEPAIADTQPADPRRETAPLAADRPVARPWTRWLPWAAALAAVAVGAAVGLPDSRSDAGAAPTAIAVLPFRNLSEDSSHAFFAEGLHDELLTQLAKVASLRVTGRASVHMYESTPKPLREIGEELAVGSVVEAGVQVVGDRLRVSVRLLDPATGAQRWAERYDRTLGDAFAVQSEIAQNIVAAVGATLTNAEGGAIASPPTRDPGAYEYYLQGLAYHRRPGQIRENLLAAEELYERAVALDSSFALAHAALASLDVAMYSLGYDFSEERAERARRSAERALALDPDLPQVQLAAGLVQGMGLRFREALQRFQRALAGAPGDTEILTWIGINHRTLGNFDSSLAALEHARRLDPRDANLAHTLGDTYHYLHRYPEAIAAYRSGLAFAPDLVQSRLSLGWSWFLWKGELDSVRAVLDRLPLDGSPGGGGQGYGDQRLTVLLWERRPDSALTLFRAMQAQAAGPGDPYRRLLASDAHALRRDTANARATYQSIAAELAGAGDRLMESGAHAVRGMALASLGRKEEAWREVRRLEQLEAELGDSYNSWLAHGRIRILARMGEADSALPLIRRLLSQPSILSEHELRLSYEFDPLRNDPRFTALLRPAPAS